MAENNETAESSSTPNVMAIKVAEAFEAVLAAFPDDVSVLESLIMAYDQAGEKERARDRALQLGQLLAAQHDWKRLDELVGRRLALHPDHPDFLALQQEVQAMREVPAAAVPAAPKPSPETALAALQSDIRGELDLGWMLVESEVITSDQYEKAVESLMENRASAFGEGTLSLLQELQASHGMDMERIVGSLSQRTETPFILLSQYEIDEALVHLIPMKYIKGLSVLPFARLGAEIMVAVLNPVDQNLRKSLTSYLQTRVHFYFTSPEEFQAAMEALQNNKKPKKPAA